MQTVTTGEFLSTGREILCAARKHCDRRTQRFAFAALQTFGGFLRFRRRGIAIFRDPAALPSRSFLNRDNLSRNRDGGNAEATVSFPVASPLLIRTHRTAAGWQLALPFASMVTYCIQCKSRMRSRVEFQASCLKLLPSRGKVSFHRFCLRGYHHVVVLVVVLVVVIVFVVVVVVNSSWRAGE